MRAVTDQEVRTFLAEHPGMRCEGRHIFYDNPEANCVVLDLPREPGQLVFLARLVAALGYEEGHFRGAVLWITEWGVWDPQVEAVGFKALERFRLSFGESRSLESASAHYFRHDEFVDTVALLLQPMLIGWDAYYVPQWAYGGTDHFIFVSHDSYLAVVTRTAEMHRRVLQGLHGFEWLKYREQPLERFCPGARPKE